MNRKSKSNIGLNLDIRNFTDAEYKNVWNSLHKIQIQLVEKNGECKHNIGDTFIYDTPYKRPDKVCFSLLHVLDLYTWRVVLGYPSWNCDDRSVYRIHCPDATGTIWEMRRLP